MLHGNVNEMAAKFTAAYLALKEKKDLEKLLSIIRPMVLSAKADGISDKELIEIINDLGLGEKFYPAKLKDLRNKLLRADHDASTEDGGTAPLEEVAPAGSLGTAFNGGLAK